ncbi:LAFE_0H02036g1_1 [Lachancea fermentati]|uniref:LAFE_0H02036g1_1 n=1 Tax=Lachancea fermentati TaxID=4955 RepID=A0A1G4MJ62_LACFM|nr:LAFE_0H02036g1_1 [Lachancea fermentati]
MNGHLSYLRDQARLYSKGSFAPNDDMAESTSFISQRLNSGYGYLSDKKTLRDGSNIFDKFKSKLNLFKYDVSSLSEDTTARRHRQLWNIVREKPIQIVDNGRLESTSPQKITHEAQPQILESANTFLTQNANDDYAEESAGITSPGKRKEGIPSVPLSGSPFVSRADLDYIGVEPDSLIGNDIGWDKLSGRSPLKRRTTLHTIQKRLLNISNRKQEVWKSYQKLLRELNEWWQDTIDTEESVKLISDLQRLFHEDLVYENRISVKLREISKALEFTKLREDEMLLERKELKAIGKKYGHIRSKKGDQSEEAMFLREKVKTKQKSLSDITGHYQQSLSTTARELFINASVEFFETSSDMKEASRAFFQNSIQHLRSIQAENIEQHLEDLRRKRADKQWSKLTNEEKGDPCKLVEIMSAMYNGQDSLMRCIGKVGSSKALSGEGTGKENKPTNTQDATPKLEFKTGLDETLSEFPSDHNACGSPGKGEVTEITNIPHISGSMYKSMDPQKTLNANLKIATPVSPFRNQSHDWGQTLKKTDEIRKRNDKSLISTPIEIANRLLDDHRTINDGLIIKFDTSGANEVSRNVFEPEQELDRNKWAESPPE